MTKLTVEWSRYLILSVLNGFSVLMGSVHIKSSHLKQFLNNTNVLQKITKKRFDKEITLLLISKKWNRKALYVRDGRKHP